MSDCQNESLKGIALRRFRSLRRWQTWVCPLIAGIVFVVMGGELASRWFAFMLLCMTLGRIDKEIDP